MPLEVLISFLILTSKKQKCIVSNYKKVFKKRTVQENIVDVCTKACSHCDKSCIGEQTLNVSIGNKSR